MPFILSSFLGGVLLSLLHPTPGVISATTTSHNILACEITEHEERSILF